jgi:hypothetical protein
MEHAVKEGEELTQAWGDGGWDVIADHQLLDHALTTRTYNCHLNALEQVLIKHRLLVPPAPPMPKRYDIVYQGTHEDVDDDQAVAPIASGVADAAGRVLRDLREGKTFSAKQVAQKARANPSEPVLDPFERVGVGELQTIDTSDLKEEVIESLNACRTVVEDERHWQHAYAELLRTIVDGAAGCNAYIAVAVEKNPLSPVNLFTPPSVTPYTAIAKADIAEGWPIAQYSGRLIDAREASAKNHYLYELPAKKMAKRGYRGPVLLVNSEEQGNEARFINDDWTPRGLPKRQPNCYVELVFDPVKKLPYLIWFASKKIRKGQELVGSYGPHYWRHVFKNLIGDLMKATEQLRHKCDHIEGWMQINHPEVELVPALGGSVSASTSTGVSSKKRRTASVYDDELS